MSFWGGVCYRHAGPADLRIYHQIMSFAARKTPQVSIERTASTYCKTERRRCGMSVEKPAQETVMRSVGPACSSDRGHASCRPYGAPDVILGGVVCYRHAGPAGLRIYHQIMGFAARKTPQVSIERTASTYCKTERRRCGMSVEKPVKETVTRSVGPACSSDRDHASCRPYGAPDVILGGRVLQTCRPYGPQDSEAQRAVVRVVKYRRHASIDHNSPNSPSLLPIRTR